METENQPLKTTIRSAGLVILGIGLVIGGCAKKHSGSSWSLDKSDDSAKLRKLIAAPEAQARTLAKQDGKKLPSDSDAFYRAAETGNWQDAANLFKQMSKSIQNDSSLRGNGSAIRQGVFAIQYGGGFVMVALSFILRALIRLIRKP